MEGKIAIRSNAEEKNLPTEVESKEIKSDRNYRTVEKPSQCNGKITENSGVKIQNLSHGKMSIKEKELSEGEASSGFETVSSIDSNMDFDVLDLSSIADEEDFNMVVEIENELALRNHHGLSRRAFHWKETNKIPSRYSSSVSKHTNRSYNFRTDPKYWRNNTEATHYKYDRRDKNSSEREPFSHKRKQSFHDHDWDRNINWNRRSKIRRSDTGSRSRYSRSTEPTPRSKDSRTPERNIKMKSPGSKDRKPEMRCLRSCDNNMTKSNLKRNSSPRKGRRRSFSKSPTTSVWKRLDNRTSPGVEKRSRKSSRKKERTPFLVELERKLKEVKELKTSKKDTSNEPRVQQEVSKNMNVPLGSEVLPIISQNPMHLPPPNIPSVGYPFNYSFPALSLDNLPLVLGPTGVPVHITMTGEQIPHDFDGRLIPVGPNGHYLPLDPTGRLFPHIVSPGNQAVPIHMTEDGVLRLPNSEPVPYGPLHQLPVNTDGRVIPIGPDSKPLSMPCPNLPTHPPLSVLNFMNSAIPENAPPERVPQIIPPTPQTGNQQRSVTESQQGWNRNQGNFQTPKADCISVDVIQNPSRKTSTADSFKNTKRTPEKIPDESETRKSFGTKRSVPMKLYQRKTTKDDTNTSGSDMVLDDLGSVSVVKSELKSPKGSTEEITLSSVDELDILNLICDKETSNVSEIKPKELIIKKVVKAIKSLGERDYKPPTFGRFVVSSQMVSVMNKFPNESPLLRNRIILPFLTPNTINSCPRNESEANERTEITFKFLSQKVFDNEGKSSDVPRGKSVDKNANTVKVPIFSFDSAVQCDLMSEIINNLNSKVTELEMEVVRLRNLNESLLEDYRNAQILNEKKSDELSKALLDIRDRKKEIQALKLSVRRRGK